MLTRSRVEGWTTGHLKSAALGWERAATIIEEHYGKAQSTVGRVPWTGPASDRANDKLSENMAKVRGTLDLMRDAAGIAKSGAESIDAAKDDAVNAIKDAEAQFFSVSEDLTVTDRVPWIISPALALMRKLKAAHAQADIRAKAMVLEKADQQVADQLDGMTAKLREFDLAGGKGGPADTGKAGNPKVTGLPGPLRPESKAADLNSTLPGTGIEISGDGRTGYPTLNGQRNPLEIEANQPSPDNPNGDDKVRPLPTGTIVGPDGKQYALARSRTSFRMGRRTPSMQPPIRPLWTCRIHRTGSACCQGYPKPVGRTTQRPTGWWSWGTRGRILVIERECCTSRIRLTPQIRTAGCRLSSHKAKSRDSPATERANSSHSRAADSCWSVRTISTRTCRATNQSAR